MRWNWVVVCVLMLAMLAAFSSGCAKKQVDSTPVGVTAIDAERAAEEARLREETRLREQQLEEERLSRERNEQQRARMSQMAEMITANMIHFAYDSYELRPDAREILQTKSELLKQNQEIRLLIEGHTDERGTSEYNLALGERRARAAYEFLVLLGVSPNRLQIVSYGKERPLNPASNETAWAQNRRAQFRLLDM
ncbi:peptidoglycan-associated lipoprotein [Desulfonatronum thiosulfatophilum]|uniref:Peptidoglycan-associated lipoprotein n=1 Tax=Desulfonatronum thiosulfatophilum TaxID=617002 RepID=A0A1G6DQ74_9BACT|nr:peptidoglycan-associated lipoprotein Pal [Desulfonatronum thiosulfatophilum]SDB47271.1 peptidoglycan-associated lipoprotein [Desulfonatronum thiosulfatophilum]